MVAWSSDGLHRHSWAITSPFASPLSTAVRTLTESAGGRGFETSFGPGFVALWWSDEFRLVPLQGTTGDLSAWQPGTVVATVDGGVFALDTEKTVVSFKPISGAPVEVIRASPGLRIGYFALDRKDGNRLVWVETVGDAHDGLLFTAPFTTGRVEGRSFLTHLPEVRQWPLHGVTHDGRLAYAAYSAEGVDDNTLRVVRLRDGRRWDVEKSANHKAALFVSASTLVSYEGIEIPGFHSGAWPLTLVRRSAPTGEPPIAPY